MLYRKGKKYSLKEKKERIGISLSMSCVLGLSLFIVSLIMMGFALEVLCSILFVNLFGFKLEIGEGLRAKVERGSGYGNG